METIKVLHDGGFLIDSATNVTDPNHRWYREAQRLAALPPEDPKHIDILPADPPPLPPTDDEKLAAWKADPVNAAMFKLIAADSGRTPKEMDDAIKANM